MRFPHYTALLLLLTFLAPSAGAHTASTTTDSLYSDGADESGAVRRERVREWRRQSSQSSELQQKISALPSSTSTIVFIPVLFGVGRSNIYPNFGDPRDGGARTHEGEDIMAVKGVPIVSPTPAVVIRMGVGSGEGNYVTTANPGGETFVYMHLDGFGEGVVVGSVLEAGSLVGYVGNTGNASGGAAHLHFELRDSNGVATDPFPRLTGEFTIEQKISFLTKILTQVTDETALAQFLVSNFRSTFVSASGSGITLPPAIAALLGLPAATTLPPAVTGGEATLQLSRDLYLGRSGDDVRALQRILNRYGYTVASTGVGSPGYETNYFGALTRAAVMRFQAAHSISPVAGYVGSITRGALATISF